jgi:hypothetical protein
MPLEPPPSLKCLLCLSLCVAGTGVRPRSRRRPFVHGLGNGLDTSSLANARLVSALPALKLSLLRLAQVPAHKACSPLARADLLSRAPLVDVMPTAGSAPAERALVLVQAPGQWMVLHLGSRVGGCACLAVVARVRALAAATVPGCTDGSRDGRTVLELVCVWLGRVV